MLMILISVYCLSISDIRNQGLRVSYGDSSMYNLILLEVLALIDSIR